MLICIPKVLSKAQVAACRERMDNAEWIDGRITAGEQSAAVKQNSQLPENSPLATEIGNLILDALAQTPQFISAALPLKIFPPLFNRLQTVGNLVCMSIIRYVMYRVRLCGFVLIFLAPSFSVSLKSMRAAN